MIVNNTMKEKRREKRENERETEREKGKIGMRKMKERNKNGIKITNRREKVEKRI